MIGESLYIATQSGERLLVHGTRRYRIGMGNSSIPLTVELIPDEEQGGFTARIPDIPAYGEGETEEEAIADLQEAVRGYIETFGLADALGRVSHPSYRRLDWDLTELARG
ncbi:MAG: type II toxin-antitoxin system HicB family antitoxin [Pirellulales bacterium]